MEVKKGLRRTRKSLDLKRNKKAPVETPLRSRRKLRRQQSTPPSPPQPPLEPEASRSQASTPPSPPQPPLEPEVSRNQASAPASPPQPTLKPTLKESRINNSSLHRLLSSPPTLQIKVEGFEVDLHCGSEASSDESEDEESVPEMFLPRALRNALDTPMDPEVDACDPFDATAGFVPAASDIPLSATDQPWNLYDFHWKSFPDAPIRPDSRRETFSKINVGPTAPCVDPYDVFVGIWDRQFMEYIASETNRYAQQVASEMLCNNRLAPFSRISKWRETSADELYVYFGIVIAMGVVIKSRFDEYWNTTPDVFFTPGFSVHMSGKRFAVLSKCLHFNNNDDLCASEFDTSEAKIYKVQPVLTHLNEKFQSMYRLGQNIALDESLLMWNGCLDINHLNPNKSASADLKTYELCEPQTGYLWRFEVHANKKSSPQQSEDHLNASIPAIVLRLTHGLEGNGHTLWMDSYYNSPCLARRLKSLGFDCVGTLRTNRKFVPQALHSLTKASMRPGEVSGLTSGDVDVVVWRDNSRVAMISTYHGNAVSHVRSAARPILILEYNVMMGLVDKKDQMLAMYPIERKRTKVWYKKLFRRLLNVSVLNSYIIHRQSTPSPSSPITHRNFRISLVNSLFTKHSIPKQQNLQNLQTLQRYQQIDVTHRIAEYPINKQGKQRIRRLCVQCKKLVHTFCFGCVKSVCIEPCFVALHK